MDDRNDNAVKTENSFIEKQRSKFAACQQKLYMLSCSEKEEYQKQLHKLIDELIALEYTLKLVDQEVTKQNLVCSLVLQFKR